VTSRNGPSRRLLYKSHPVGTAGGCNTRPVILTHAMDSEGGDMGMLAAPAPRPLSAPTGRRLSSINLKVQGYLAHKKLPPPPWCRVQRFGFGVWVWGLECRVWGIWCRIWGPGLTPGSLRGSRQARNPRNDEVGQYTPHPKSYTLHPTPYLHPCRLGCAGLVRSTEGHPIPHASVLHGYRGTSRIKQRPPPPWTSIGP